MSQIFEKVKEIESICTSLGQQGLLNLTENFDKVKLSSLKLSIKKDVALPKDLENAILTSRDNVYKFHKSEHSKLASFELEKIETSPEIVCWKKFTPIESVGVYVPNRLFSSAIMNIVPAQIAGCNNIVVCTPPNPSEEIIFTLNLLGIEEVYTLGGAQAVFAMAYGIGEVPMVSKIFGPGNEFVDMAKRLVSTKVAIDMPAGPSEVLVIADKAANINSVAFDVLAQLEHGAESKAWVFTTDATISESIRIKTGQLVQTSDRKNILSRSINNLQIRTFENVDEAINESNEIAPEHLILNFVGADDFLSKIKNAGSVFIGSDTPESLGDYISGTNHVLPTNGFGKAFSGLSVLSFGKFTTFQKATSNGLAGVAEKVRIMAVAEGLEFHAQSTKRN